MQLRAGSVSALEAVALGRSVSAGEKFATRTLRLRKVVLPIDWLPAERLLADSHNRHKRVAGECPQEARTPARSVSACWKSVRRLEVSQPAGSVSAPEAVALGKSGSAGEKFATRTLCRRKVVLPIDWLPAERLLADSHNRHKHVAGMQKGHPPNRWVPLACTRRRPSRLSRSADRTAAAQCRLS